MPRPGAVSTDDIKAYVDQGYTYQQAAEHFGLPYGTVTARLNRANQTRFKAKYEKWVHPQATAAQKTSSIHKRARDMARSESGELGKNATPAFEEWKATLDAAGLIADFDADQGPNPASPAGGYYLRPRKPGEQGRYFAWVE